jgi:CubicO group peptidase (beta-lactamase class C family)
MFMTFAKSIWSRRAVVRGGLALAGAAALGPRAGKAADVWDPVRAAVNDAAGENGAALLVLTPGAVAFRDAFGSTLIQIPGILASASIGSSAIALLALVDQGGIGLDDPISKHLDVFTGEKKEITLRHCLTHTSGLVDPGDLLVPPAKDPGVTLEQEVDRAAKTKLIAKPGAAFRFGGMGYQAAGRAAEVASGTAWELLFKQLIDDPLGAGFTFGETPDPRLAGGASANIDSYGAVLQMLLNDGAFNGARILSKSTVRALRTNQIAGATQATPVSSEATSVGYGLGWWLEAMDGTGLANRINAAGAYGTVPWVDFEKKYAAIVMMQATQQIGLDLVAKIRPLIEAALG